jgi:UDP-glucose 4-epimerase
VVLDDLSTGISENLAPAAQLYQGDIADRDLLDTVLRQHWIDGVVHIAGSALVPESVAVPARYYRNNAFRSLELVDFLVARGIKRFLFSSSAAVYGIPAGGAPFRKRRCSTQLTRMAGPSSSWSA